MHKGIQPRTAWDRLWEKSLLRPGVALLRILVTLMALGGVIGVFSATSRIGGDERVLVVLAGIVAVALLYCLAMVIPDFLWYVLQLDRATIGAAARPAPRSRYPFLLVVSDLARFNAVAVAVATGVAVIQALAPSLFVTPYRDPASWWRFLAPLMFLVLLALVVHGFLRRVRAADLSASRYLVGAFALLVVLDSVLTAPGNVAGLIAVLSLMVAGVAGWRAYSGYVSENSIEAVTSAAVAAMFLVIGVGAIRFVPAVLGGLSHLLGPWLGVGQSLLTTTGGLIRREGHGTFAVVLLLIMVIGGVVAFLGWVRGDFYRSLLSVFCHVGGDESPRSHKPHLVVVRWLAVIATAVLVVGSIVWSGGKLLLIRGLHLPLGLAGVGPGWLLVMTLGFAASTLAVLDVFQGVADANCRFDGKRRAKAFDFKWLKAFTYVLYLAVIGLALGFLAVFSEALRYFGRQPIVLLGILALGVAAVACAALLPVFLLDLLRLEAATRPAGESRVRAAAGYPGFSFLIGFGRFLTGLVLIAGVFGTVAATMEFGQRDAEQGAAIVIGGILGTLVLSIQIGAVPDLLSLLLTLKRNLQDVEGEEPEVVVTEGGGNLVGLLPEALREIGETPLDEPIIPPSGGALGVIRGVKGIYEIRLEDGKPVVLGPDGGVCGRFDAGGFIPKVPRKVSPDLDLSISERIDTVSEGRGRVAPRGSGVENPARGVGGGDPGAKTEPVPRSFGVGHDRDDTTPSGGRMPSDEQSPVSGGTGVTPPPIPEVGQDPDDKTPEAGLHTAGRPAQTKPRPTGGDGEGWEELIRLPLDSGHRTQALVVVALAELLIARDVVKRHQVQLTSVMAAEEIVLQARNSRELSGVRETVRGLKDRHLRMARGLVGAGSAEKKRLDFSDAEPVRDPDGLLLAPGWVGGKMPPLRVRLVDRFSGKAVKTGTRVTKRRIAFITVMDDVISVWEVKV